MLMKYRWNVVDKFIDEMLISWWNWMINQWLICHWLVCMECHRSFINNNEVFSMTCWLNVDDRYCRAVTKTNTTLTNSDTVIKIKFSTVWCYSYSFSLALSESSSTQQAGSGVDGRNLRDADAVIIYWHRQNNLDLPTPFRIIVGQFIVKD